MTFTEEKFLAMMGAFEDAVHDRDPTATVGFGRAPTGHIVVMVEVDGNSEAYAIDPNTCTWMVVYGHF